MLAGRLVLSLLLAGFQLTFRAGVDITTFAVTVTDRKGNIVTDLAKEDFEIVEDGKAQALQYFARGVGETTPAMHVGLMVDASGRSEERRVGKECRSRWSPYH